QDNPMRTWFNFREEFLDEVLRLDGLGDDQLECRHCPDGVRHPASYRCCMEECTSVGLTCKDCCLRFHLTQPLHFIEKWDGTRFETIELRGLGLSVQLGHPVGTSCPFRHITTNEFTVLHFNGVHTVSIFFCGCTGAPRPHVQLLRASLWPATPLEPRTATTFAFLRMFHILNSFGKVPCWDVWKTLETMSWNRTGIKPPDRYKVLLRAIRQWRHIKMAKRAGRGHDSTGIAGTSTGELAVECPACPHPRRNLPNNWRTLPNQFRFRLFLGTDANFRARNTMVSTHERDPPLGDGLGSFITQGPYNAHILNFVSQDDMASCSGFRAIALANLKDAKGLRTTGIVGVTCARHSIWRANSMGNLQRGERYCNVDPVVASAMKPALDDYIVIVLSYDIICIWAVHFWDRVKELPREWRIRAEKDGIIFMIPKFHLWAHKVRDCHHDWMPCALFFQLSDWSGPNHGETIEENWSQSNRAASQTKMMGPGARQDTLDDVFAFHNWRTVQSFDRVLAVRMVEALKEAPVHAKEFEDYHAGMVLFCGETVVNAWSGELQAWEQDYSRPCPYEPQLQHKPTLHDVELELAKEEQEADTRAGGVTRESSTAVFLQLLLEIESKHSSTTYQELNIQRTRNDITRNIKKFRGLQQIFMPNLREYLTADQLKYIDAPQSFQPEETKLFAPSELPDHALPRACAPNVLKSEERLREAECRDSLESIRQGLRTRGAAHTFTVRNITGQNPTTRAQGVLRKIQININLQKLRYRWARNALFRIRKHGAWERELQVLKDGNLGIIDERILEPPTSAATSEGEGRRRLSWLWYSYPGGLSEQSTEESNTTPLIHEALKIEWCKAQARKLRWEEEVHLLAEEMRRVIEFRRWKAGWWRSRASERPNVTDALKQGLVAFAESQAVREEHEALNCETRWQGLRDMAQAFIDGRTPSGNVEIEVELDDETMEGDMEDDIE
ncbi:hypothetical protein BDZ89DRAFT_969307, partial [Hymenopellis radicata]